MKDRSVLLGSVVAGLLASACCIGPLILGAVGLGSLGFAAALAPYRPWFLGLTAALLIIGFYFSYRPLSAPACGPDGACPVHAGRRNQRIVIWIAAILAVGLATYPRWGAAVVTTHRASRKEQADRPAQSAEAASSGIVTLDISGMTCSACAGEIETKLGQVPGVTNAAVNFKESRATVRVGTPEPTTAALVSAVQAAGYRAMIVAETGPQPKGDRSWQSSSQVKARDRRTPSPPG